MSEKKGERRELKARLPVGDLEQLERIKEQTGKPLNDLLVEAVELYLRSRWGAQTSPQPGDRYPTPHHQPGDKPQHLGSSTVPGDKHLGTGAQPGDRLEPTPNVALPGQEEVLAGAQRIIDEKRSQTTFAPIPISQAIEASARRGVLQRLLCYVDTCDGGAARTIDGKSYCAHHASLEEYSKPATPLAPPISTVTLPPCDVCQGRRFLVTENDGKIAASRCSSCFIDCKACEKGLVFWKDSQGYEKWLLCGCRKAPIERQLAAIQLAEFPGAFASVLFGKLPPGGMSESQKNAHVLSWEWAKKFTTKEKSGFFFYGAPGTGKTLSLCRALALLIQRESSKRVRYLHFPSWLDLKKQSFGNEELTMECASELVGPEVLLVDEILLQGKGGTVRSFTEWERSQFDLMVHNRWLSGKPTLYATNYKPEQVEAEVSESTWSRIRSTSMFLEVIGKDMRFPNNILPFTLRDPK
jgi:hypothetical protein